MKIETVDPGPAAVREAVRAYVERYPEYAEALEAYGAIMVAQQEALEQVECPMGALDAEVVEAKLVLGDTLLEPDEVPVDGKIYRELVSKICDAMSKVSEKGLDFCQNLVNWDGLADDEIAATRDRLLAGEELGFVPDPPLSDPDEELVKIILWEGLAPFYRACGSMLTVNMEQSWWQRASCPVCGADPVMGMYRQGDGLWLLECSLCHTQWNVQRAACPFCYESQGSLAYLHLEEDPSRRANYCKVCKRYIKTVDLRSSEDETLLPLEAIVSLDLDAAAEQEGLLSASDGS